MLDSVYKWKSNRKKDKKSGGNLLDYLRPGGMEARLVRSCRDLIGVNKPQARLLLQAHEVLLRFAMRHQLISPADAAQTEKELARLWQELQGN